MAKKLIIVWLSLTIVFFSSISIYADENVQGDYFVKHVVINGAEIVNRNLQYPFLLLGYTTYFPLTPEMGEICGFTAEMDWESRTLKLLKTDSTRSNISSNWMKNNGDPMNLTILSGTRVLVYDDRDESNESEVLSAFDSSVHEMDMDGLPVLAIGKTVFLPLRAMQDDSSFGWNLYFDSYYGVCISTKPGVKAETFCDKKESLYNQGLAQYIRNYNSGISKTYAQQLVFMFKDAAKSYGVDEKVLMAIAHKESTFNASAVSGGGAVGLMQIMPGTAKGYGVTITQLYDARVNINIGAALIGAKLTAYGGDYVKALSAYNQGSLRVNRGTHSTAYASRVLAANSGIGNYLLSNGYVAQI
ncbi:MAG: transglycosylase SLT domain-containing protein [Clostridia bacterium]|nr:transglycosylase SLT domain-containing protein [Clostridia bacterium]